MGNKMTQEQFLSLLARRYYQLHGHATPPGYDLENSLHPQEQLMWRLAEEAFFCYGYFPDDPGGVVSAHGWGSTSDCWEEAVETSPDY